MTPMEMTPEIFEKVQRGIRRRNAYFARLTPARKRVYIARDVLAQLREGDVIAKKGTYLDLGDGLMSKLGRATDNKQVATVLRGEACEVCAIGATFVCAVKKLDSLKIGDVGGNITYHDNMRDYLVATGAFTYDDLAAMEAAFEGFRNNGFNEGIDDPKERMRRVMQRIVSTGGRVSFPARRRAQKVAAPQPGTSGSCNCEICRRRG